MQASKVRFGPGPDIAALLYPPYTVPQTFGVDGGLSVGRNPAQAAGKAAMRQKWVRNLRRPHSRAHMADW